MRSDLSDISFGGHSSLNSEALSLFRNPPCSLHLYQFFGNVNTISTITYGPSVTITDLIHHYKIVSIFGVIGNLKMALASYLMNYIVLYGITWYCFVLNGIAWY